MLSTTQLY